VAVAGASARAAVLHPHVASESTVSCDDDVSEDSDDHEASF